MSFSEEVIELKSLIESKEGDVRNWSPSFSESIPLERAKEQLRVRATHLQQLVNYQNALIVAYEERLGIELPHYLEHPHSDSMVPCMGINERKSRESRTTEKRKK